MNVSAIDRLHHLIVEASGLVFPGARRRLLEDAVDRTLLRMGLPDTQSLQDLIEKNDPIGREALKALIESITVGETYFFRDHLQFDALENHVLPELIERRSDVRRLRIWSAGCATGEEPYSLAMLLDSILRDRNAWTIEILGTDVNRAALARAQMGIYRDWSFRRMPHSMMARYFSRSDRGWVIADEIREMVTFRYLNLAEAAYPSAGTGTEAVDLILCRNVLIYLGEAIIRDVLGRFRLALTTDGWFATGHSEPLRLIAGHLDPRPFPGTMLYQKDPTIPPRPERSPRTSIGPARPIRARSSPRLQPTHKTPALQPPDGASTLIQAAIEALEAGRFEEAERSLVDAVSTDTSSPRAPYLLGKLFADRLEMEPAATWVSEALSRDGTYVPAHHLTGLIAEEEDREQDAITAFRRCIYLAPTWPLGYYALGRALATSGRRGASRRAFDSAERLLSLSSPDEEVPDSDGLTNGRLLELTRAHKTMAGSSGGDR